MRRRGPGQRPQGSEHRPREEREAEPVHKERRRPVALQDPLCEGEVEREDERGEDRKGNALRVQLEQGGVVRARGEETADEREYSGEPEPAADRASTQARPDEQQDGRGV